MNYNIYDTHDVRFDRTGVIVFVVFNVFIVLIVIIVFVVVVVGFVFVVLEFLKELGLTEGRSTGIPTIQDELSKNGSPKATFETDEDRSFFVVHIPIHQAYLNIQSAPSDRTVNRTVKANETPYNKIISENPQNEESDTNRTVKRTINEILQNLPEFCTILYNEIKKRPNSSYQELAKNLGKGRTTISEAVKILKDNGLISREGSPKTGNWIILK